jgi:hypothetical protein
MTNPLIGLTLGEMIALRDMLRRQRLGELTLDERVAALATLKAINQSLGEVDA